MSRANLNNKGQTGYTRRKRRLIYYKKVSQAGSEGYFNFLYTHSRYPNTLILGEGWNLSTAVALYRAPAVEGNSSVTQWFYVWDSTKEGRPVDKGWPTTPRPDMRVEPLDANITGEDLREQLQRGEDFVTEEYIVCKLDRPYFHLQTILRDSHDPGVHCHADRHCKSYERCQVLTL